MELVHEYYGASGFSCTNCCFIGKRYNKEWGYKPLEGECWLFIISSSGPEQVVISMSVGSTEEMTGVWFSENANIYLCSGDGVMIHKSRIKTDVGFEISKGTVHELEGSLTGIWGLNDELIFTWGSSWKEGPLLYKWEGKSWEQMKSPDFSITSMHGVSPDCIYATGYDGGIAKWNGKEWLHFTTPVDELFTSVFVVDEQEQYAVGVNNYVLQGNGIAWKVIALGPSHAAPLPVPLTSVAKWKDKLWIGADINGLLCRIGDTDQLEVVKPNLFVSGIDARENLLLSCPELVVQTTEGVNYVGRGRGTLEKNRKDKKLLEGFE